MKASSSKVPFWNANVSLFFKVACHLFNLNVTCPRRVIVHSTHMRQSETSVTPDTCRIDSVSTRHRQSLSLCFVNQCCFSNLCLHVCLMVLTTQFEMLFETRLRLYSAVYFQWASVATFGFRPGLDAGSGAVKSWDRQCIFLQATR